MRLDSSGQFDIPQNESKTQSQPCSPKSCSPKSCSPKSCSPKSCSHKAEVIKLKNILNSSLDSSQDIMKQADDHLKQIQQEYENVIGLNNKEIEILQERLKNLEMENENLKGFQERELSQLESKISKVESDIEENGTIKKKEPFHLRLSKPKMIKKSLP